MGSWMIYRSGLMCAQGEGADDRNRNDRERDPRGPVSHSVPLPRSPVAGIVWAMQGKMPASSGDRQDQQEDVTGSPSWTTRSSERQP